MSTLSSMGQDGPLSLVGGIVELCVCVWYMYDNVGTTIMHVHVRMVHVGRLSSRSANKFRICYNSMNVYMYAHRILSL